MNYNPDSFASIMRAIYYEQEKRYEDANIESHPRTHQELVKLRAKITKAYGSQSKGRDTIPINRIAEGVLLGLRDGKHVQDVMKLSNTKLLNWAVSDA